VNLPAPAFLRFRQQLRLHLPRVRRYAAPVLRHGTPRKLANILLAEAELRLARTTLRARPYYYLIDICNACNLRCPLCATGVGALGRTQGSMSFEEYRAIFDKVKRDALVVSLYNHGEPFLNKDVFDIIEYTAQNNVGSQVSSNFNWPMLIDPRDIVNSGLEYVTVSLDGVSQESYEKYRVGGEIAQVIDNMRGLLAAREALGSRTPFVEWQFIVFQHNEHEMDEARELAEKWGVDLLRFVAPGVPPEMMDDPELRAKWMPRDPLFSERNPEEAADRGYVYDRTCFYLYRSMAIYYGGGVTPCCFSHDQKDDFGNIHEQSVAEIWNNDRYRSARMLFQRKRHSEARVPVVCDACPMFRQPGGRDCGGPGV
jgi:radical SAM protein with 4Fe4S-binding SPASM domain